MDKLTPSVKLNLTAHLFIGGSISSVAVVGGQQGVGGGEETADTCGLPPGQDQPPPAEDRGD